MRFVKEMDLKRGMRIGRPIFNRKGDLIFDRDTRITDEDILKLRNLKVMGIFTLDPGEPLPPMSAEEFEYEKQRFLNVYALRDEMKEILVIHRARKLESIVDSIIAASGGFKKRIEFPQSIRSRDEYVCSHSVNVASLVTLMGSRLGLVESEKKIVVLAALLHDIGKFVVPDKILEGETPEETERILFNAQDVGFEMIDNVLPEDVKVVNICINAYRILRDHRFLRKSDVQKPNLLTRLLVVADSFDSMTAIDASGGKDPDSYVVALRHMRFYPEVYDVKVTEALEASIEILKPGTTAMLNNRRKALVTALTGTDVLRPTVLELETNRILNLEEQANRDIEIVDVVKKLDDRHVVDR